MAPASKEATRKQRSIALSRLNTALEDFNKSRSQDAINLDTVRARIRTANIAYGRFMACHNKFLDSLSEEAAMDKDLVDSTTAFNKINTAKAQFLAFKRANSGPEPSVPLAEKSSQMAGIPATGVDPERDAGDPILGSASAHAGPRQGGKGGSRRKGRRKQNNGRGNSRRGESVDDARHQRQEARCLSLPRGLYSCPEHEKMDDTERRELIKKSLLRHLCVPMLTRTSDTNECITHRCPRCQRLHNRALHCEPSPQQIGAPPPQQMDLVEHSEMPFDLDLCTLKLQEALALRKPKTDPSEVSVNWIGGVHHIEPPSFLGKT